MFNTLYSHRQQLETIFKSFDTDGNGLISRQEFDEGCQLLNKSLPEGHPHFSDPGKLMGIVDFDNDGEISINEFLE